MRWLTSRGQHDQAMSLLNTVYGRVRNQAALIEAAELLELEEQREGEENITYTFLSRPL